MRGENNLIGDPGDDQIVQWSCALLNLRTSFGSKKKLTTNRGAGFGGASFERCKNEPLFIDAKSMSKGSFGQIDALQQLRRRLNFEFMALSPSFLDLSRTFVHLCRKKKRQ